MLLSELEERGRRFKLALRAGLPILLLISLIFYTTFLKSDSIDLSIENSLLIAGIIFISIYFIYFLLEQDAQETLLDSATMGFNKIAFEKKLISSEPKTIALLIIKNLTSINENYGSTEGNKLLFSTIQRLNQSLKEDGLEKAIIGRRYGAEFLIAINNKPNELNFSLERFVKNNNSINSIDIDYEFSIATYTKEGLETIIAHLKDEIATANKSPKKNTNKHKIKNISEVQEVEDCIINAVKKKNLLFTFRPLLNVSTDTVDLYEISVKLKSDSHGSILPRTYLPVINRLGLGREYDFAIVKHLIDLLPLLDNHISLTFNISPFSLRNNEFQDKFFNHLSNSNIDATRLIIELYERKAHHNLGNYFQTLTYMRTKGLRIAIDNFGSSNASMEYMKHFKFDMVQFDRDYVTKLDDPVTYQMLTSLVTMSKNLNIITVAKWVDKESQKEKLKALGVDYMQGFGIGKPISEKDLINSYN